MIKKFKVAFNGLYIASQHKACMIQFFLAALAVVIGMLLKLNENEWLMFIICIGFVIAAEIFNTAIEKLCDLVEPNYNLKIKEIKDLSAGAVLTAAIMAFFVAIIILSNRTY